jgi:hypothetical protein
MTTRAPAAPKVLSANIMSMACASASDIATTTLAAARPSALITIGAPFAST